MRNLLMVMALCLLIVLMTGCDGPTDSNIEKLSVGMSLSEVESVIGTGTPYSEIDNPMEKYGFKVDAAELQKNTCVWPRSDGSAFIVTFHKGKLQRSMTVTSPK